MPLLLPWPQNLVRMTRAWPMLTAYDSCSAIALQSASLPHDLMSIVRSVKTLPSSYRTFLDADSKSSPNHLPIISKSSLPGRAPENLCPLHADACFADAVCSVKPLRDACRQPHFAGTVFSAIALHSPCWPPHFPGALCSTKPLSSTFKIWRYTKSRRLMLTLLDLSGYHQRQCVAAVAGRDGFFIRWYIVCGRRSRRWVLVLSWWGGWRTQRAWLHSPYRCNPFHMFLGVGLGLQEMNLPLWTWFFILNTLYPATPNSPSNADNS